MLDIARWKKRLKGAWLVAGFASVILPVFMPSVRDGSLLGNPSDLGLVSMYVLSFPSSLVTSSFLSFIVSDVLGIYSWSLGGRWLLTTLLFVVGVAQWFWLVPMIFNRRPLLQQLHICNSSAPSNLTEPTEDMPATPFIVDELTPLERVLRTGR